MRMKRVDADDRSLKQLLELEVEGHETSHGRHGSHRRSSKRAFLNALVPEEALLFRRQSSVGVSKRFHASNSRDRLGGIELNVIAKCQVAIKHDPEISPHVFGDARGFTSEGGHTQIDARVWRIFVTGGVRKIEQFRLCVFHNQAKVLENGSHLGIRLF
ncbi:hypothetical protein AGABI1DRAFT_135040 [Agaricus bisporus var. burnettii JB137-S8]|uniref:Uncharacterized protein n=1 Tax=Agaricus bisporus var. burnettii (strain JB137-S8 / ATCC MYA-4627 / FGSC 10392) TaxID=597362 RepID=K5WDK2_AGABU|nr:uncharacterized protein AGABI1DRAFT_135040 [Agaricus bisporus var. burnettii JB137-S8]EKM73326.1 hypothetical protein AGABI1DRAFT_135040 [Agaricus bisporus var. burnettii JB137-S8]